MQLSDHELAARVAEEAGQLLLRIRMRLSEPDLDPRALRDEADAASHLAIMSLLGDARPGDAVLSEEGKDNPARLSASRVWIVDPLDGTREFGEDGREDWAVHVALWSSGELIAGAVALPAAGLVLSAEPAPAVAVAANGSAPRLLVSRTRPPAWAEQLRAELGWELVPMGSAGAKAMAVVRGQGDVYVHAGGQFEWDSAAPVAVARAAGLHTSRVDGSPLRYNQPDPYLPDLVICRPDLAAQVLTAVASLI